MFKKISGKRKFSSGIIITIQVMTFTRMSAGYPYSVSSFSESGKNKFRTHSSGAGNSNNTNIRWILHPADTGKICSTITAPVAEETDYF